MEEMGGKMGEREIPLDVINMAKFTGLLASLDDLKCRLIGNAGELSQWHIKHLVHGDLGYITALPFGRVLQIKFYRMPWDIPRTRTVIRDGSGAEWESAEDLPAYGKIHLVPGCDDTWESENALLSSIPQMMVEVLDAALSKLLAQPTSIGSADNGQVSQPTAPSVVDTKVSTMQDEIIQWLIDGDEREAASFLAECSLDLEGVDILFEMVGEGSIDLCDAKIAMPRKLAKDISCIPAAIKEQIEAAIGAHAESNNYAIRDVRWVYEFPSASKTPVQPPSPGMVETPQPAVSTAFPAQRALPTTPADAAVAGDIASIGNSNIVVAGPVQGGVHVTYGGTLTAEPVTMPQNTPPTSSVPNRGKRKLASWIIGVIVVLEVAIQIAINFSTDILPESLKPHRWVSLPILAVTIITLVLLTLKRSSAE